MSTIRTRSSADLQSTPEIVFIGKGSGARRRIQPRPKRQRGPAGDRDAVPRAAPAQGRRLRARVHPTPADRHDRGAPSSGATWSSRVSWASQGINPAPPPHSHGHELYPGRPAHRASSRPTPRPTDKDAERRTPTRRRTTKPAPPPAKINVIAIADLDLIGEQFFELRRSKIEDLEFDNVTVRAQLRGRSGRRRIVRRAAAKAARPPPARRVEAQVKSFDKELAQKTKEAEDQASEELLQAQKAFDKEVESVRNRTEWDERTKEIQLANLQAVAQRRLDVKKQIIEDKKLNEIREGKAESERKIRGIRNNVRFVAAVIPPLPPLILGLFVWIGRLRRENLGANPKRLA